MTTATTLAMESMGSSARHRKPRSAQRTPAQVELDQQLDRQLAAAERRREIARLGAYAQHAKHDARETTRGAFEARMKRFAAEVDPDGALARRDPQELARRVEHALKAEMARVRLARAQKAEERRRLTEQVRRVHSDDIPGLAPYAVAGHMNTQATQRLETAEAELRALVAETVTPAITQDTPETEAAPVSAEAAPNPQPKRKQPKIVSSDGSAGSITPATRRRQTPTPKVVPPTTHEKKAAKRDNSTKRRP